MARSSPRSVFGVHGVTAYSRATGVPLGEIQVIKNSNVQLSSELVELVGGSSKYPWAAEEGSITAEMTWNVGELPDFLFELFLGIAPTTSSSAETTGNVSTPANVNGSSIYTGVVGGLTAVGLITGSAANLKFGKYVVKALTASTFALYYKTGIDMGRGTDGTFLDDALMVASAVAFTGSVATVAAFGLQFTSSTVAFTIGDTAEFSVRPVNSGYSTARVGGLANQSFPEFGALVYAQKRGNGEMVEIDAFRCKGAGMPLPFEMGAFQSIELKVKMLYDTAKDGLFDIRTIKPS